MADKNGWMPIASAPRDGRWFVTGRFVAGEEPQYEVGAYAPYLWDNFEPVENGLYRKVQEQVSEWRGFNNFHRATHWADLLPAPPEV